MAMELTTGQEVWIAFATGDSSYSGKPEATVHRGIVLDGENRVVKRDNGYVSVCSPSGVEQCHASEAEAWMANADLLERYVTAIEKKAVDCRVAAAKASAKNAVEVVT